jgi:hypothetical protein
VSAQAETLQLLDDSEDNPHWSRKQETDLTHENCPRNTLGASDRNAREMVTVVRHEKWAVDGV